MVQLFLIGSIVALGGIGVWTYFWPPAYWLFVIVGPMTLLGYWDIFQRRHAIRRNYPLIGNLRYLFEAIRPELQQYFVESNLSGRPVPREFRSIVYQRAKGVLETVPFGTERDVNLEHHEWVNHSMMPKKVTFEDARVAVGGPRCTKPYSASVFNISAMSYGSLSSAAIRSLNLAAKTGNFYHNTGEGGISSYHRSGGDLVWQIGTGYFGCRNENGTFSPEKFQEKAEWAEVKMIELKLSQGAKPGKGGMLPAAKVSKEIAEIRGVKEGSDVMSPSYHSAFSSPIELLEFIEKLRVLSGGKPVGFKLCVGRKSDFISLCRAMLETGLLPDFITVDGAEGGTGAAPLEFSNSVGTPLDEGLAFVHDALTGFGLRKDIRLISSGKVFTAFHILTKVALGADIINSARGMMLALGCIHALKCNTNRCPAGVATTDLQLTRGLDIPDKTKRVARFHQGTVHAMADILGAMGYESPSQVRRIDICRRVTDGVVKTYEDIFPSIAEGSLLNQDSWPKMNSEWQAALERGQAQAFS